MADPQIDTSETKSERTRARILDAAAAEFRHAGYNARLVDIAARADMQAGSLYYHFASREQLVAEILRLGIATAFDHVRQAVDSIGAIADGADPVARLEAALRAHTMVTLELSDYASAQARIVGQVPPQLAADREADQREYGAFWHGLLADAAEVGAIDPDIDIFAARMLALGAINWTTEWFVATRRLSAEQVADTAVKLIMSGLTQGR